VALLLVTLLSFVGLTIDVGMAYVQLRQAQAAAAAIAGADNIVSNLAVAFSADARTIGGLIMRRRVALLAASTPPSR
jgi:uncharacterized membrane protein